MENSPDKPTQYLLDFTEALFHVARKPHKIVPKTSKITKPLPPPPIPPQQQIQKLPPPPELAPVPVQIPQRQPPQPMTPQMQAPGMPNIPSAMDKLNEVTQTETPEEPPKEEFKPISYPLITEDTKVLAKADITEQAGKKLYTLTEPKIEHSLVSAMKAKLARKIMKNKATLKNDKLITKVLTKVAKQNKAKYSDDLKTAVIYYLKRDLLGLGKFDPLIKDRHITKIICEGLNKPIKVLYEDEEIKTNVVFSNHEKLNQAVKVLANRTGKKVSKSAPLLDSTLDNLKIHASLGTEIEKGKFSLEPTVSSKIIIEKTN